MNFDLYKFLETQDKIQRSCVPPYEENCNVDCFILHIQEEVMEAYEAFILYKSKDLSLQSEYYLNNYLEEVSDIVMYCGSFISYLYGLIYNNYEFDIKLIDNLYKGRYIINYEDCTFERKMNKDNFNLIIRKLIIMRKLSLSRKYHKYIEKNEKTKYLFDSNYTLMIKELISLIFLIIKLFIDNNEFNRNTFNRFIIIMNNKEDKTLRNFNGVN